MQEKPIKTKVLKHQLNIGKKLEKVWQFIEEIDLISSNNGETFNKQLLNFSQKYQVSKEKNAKRISEWRENQQVSENVTRSEHVRNALKVKESKVKLSKVNNIEDFEIFWENYDKKLDRFKCEKIWDKLTLEEINKINLSVQKYVEANPDWQYRKNPSTYLNGKCFNDEIIIYSKQQNNGNSNNEPKLGTSAARMEALKNW